LPAVKAFGSPLRQKAGRKRSYERTSASGSIEFATERREMGALPSKCGSHLNVRYPSFVA